MAQHLTYPFNDLTDDCPLMLIAGKSDIPQKAKLYAARHGFGVVVDKMGKTEDGRWLYRVQRIEVASGG